MKLMVMSVLLAGAVAVPAAAADRYTITFKKAAQGDFVHETMDQSTVGKTSLTVLGTTDTKTLDDSCKSAFQQLIVEKEPGMRPAVIRRSYEKATMYKNGRKVVPDLLNCVVVIVRSDQGIKYSVEGKELTRDDLEFLDVQFSAQRKLAKETKLDDLMLPKEPVATNETWKLDMVAIAKEFSVENPFIADPARSTGTGKLVKAYRKGGRQYGIIENEFELALTRTAKDGMAMDLNPSSRAKFSIRLEGCIDGTLISAAGTTSVLLRYEGASKIPDGEVKADVALKIKVARTVEELSKPSSPRP
jgi:hypothetical protein